MRLDLTNKGSSEMWNLAVIAGAVLILTISLPAFSSEDEHGHEEGSEPQQLHGVPYFLKRVLPI